MHSGSLVGVDPSGWDDLRRTVRGYLDVPPVGARVVAGFDYAVVVVRADQHEVVQRGGSVGPPGLDVVGMAGGGWLVAAGEHTAAVTNLEGGPDRGGDQALRPAHIEQVGVSAEHGGHYVSVTHQLPQYRPGYRLTGAGQVAVQQTRVGGGLHQHFVGQGDHHPWPIPTMARRQRLLLVGMYQSD